MQADTNNKCSRSSTSKIQTMKDHSHCVRKRPLSCRNVNTKRFKSGSLPCLDGNENSTTHAVNSLCTPPICSHFASNCNSTAGQDMYSEGCCQPLEDMNEEDFCELDESLSVALESPFKGRLTKRVRRQDEDPCLRNPTAILLPMGRYIINLLNLGLIPPEDCTPQGDSDNTSPFPYNAMRIHETCLNPSELQDEEDEEEGKVLWCDFCGFLDEHEYHQTITNYGGELSWLMREIMVCSDYHMCPQVVAAGELQAALHMQKHIQDHSMTFALLTLLRLIVSYRKELPTLEFLVGDIYDFVLNILATPEKFYHNFWKYGTLNGHTRMYSDFMALSLAAHARPIHISDVSIPYDQQVQYEKITPSFLSQYQRCFLAVNKGKAHGLPHDLNELYYKLSTHKMACDVFIELNRHGLWERYTGDDNYSTRCCRVMDKFTTNIEKQEYRTILLYYVIYLCPKITPKIKESRELFDYAKENVTSFIQQNYSEDLGDSDDHNYSRDKPMEVSVHDASGSARLLICVVLAAKNEGIASGFVYDLRTSLFSHNLFRYLMAAPYMSRIIGHPNYHKFYEYCWTLLITIGFTFPLRMDELVRLACNESIPITLRGHAALEIASFILVSRNQLAENILQRVYGTLREYAVISPTVELRNARIKLVFLMKMLIEYGLQNPNNNTDHFTPKGMLDNVFNPVLYHEDLGQDYLEDNDSKDYRECLAMLKE